MAPSKRSANEELDSTSHKAKHSTYSSANHPNTVYGSSYGSLVLPKFRLPADGMPASTTLQFIRDDLQLDGNPVLNLASFVTTWMEPEAHQLFMENISKNFVDAEEYPMSVEIQNRCVNMIASLFHAPGSQEWPKDDCITEEKLFEASFTNENLAVGVSTVGSSEAIMLSCLAAKRKWQNERKAKGLPCDKPNVVLSSNVQVCWEKAARYLELEARYIPCDEEHWFLNTEEAIKHVDENTILVSAILGSTYTGHYEDVGAMNKLLKEYKKKTGIFIPIHVDAASGGFVAPFAAPDLVWDFRLEHVVSINVSGHKYGLCYPGIGWAVWRGKEYLPEELIFHINYLGGDQASFTLNFSKNAANIIAQYYIFLRLGFNGFKQLYDNLYGTAKYLADAMENIGCDIISSLDPNKSIPLVSARFKPSSTRLFNERDVVHVLREYGWIVPSYTMAPNLQDVTILRVVIREDLSRNRCDLLVKDIKLAVEYLKNNTKEQIETRRKAGHHSSRLGRIATTKNAANTGLVNRVHTPAIKKDSRNHSSIC